MSVAEIIPEKNRQLIFEDAELKLQGDSDQELNILHFCDAYNIEGYDTEEPAGGAARFATVLSELRRRSPDSLVVFSGDVVAPSNISTYTKGVQMIDVF